MRVGGGEAIARRQRLAVEHAGVDEEHVEAEPRAIGDVAEGAPGALHARQDRDPGAEGREGEAEHGLGRGALEARLERGEHLASDADHRREHTRWRRAMLPLAPRHPARAAESRKAPGPPPARRVLNGRR